ncbi:MAG: MOSC domain-containing protein [Planctomycetaceae bacterium]|nr:MOSC domain-containing protein [Planctomycetota bacterium]NUN51474.1 MOSC domain-containing protein [Planctomycetaceae bacterium]
MSTPAVVLSVCRGLPAEHLHPDGTRVRTAIFKAPVAGPVAVRRLGLEGDGQADRRHHGGEEKALYAISATHYPHFARLLGRELERGQFGENLTLSVAEEEGIRRGDRFRCGTALVEVTTPRVPCRMVDLRVGPGFLGPFLDSGRWGFYLRVVEEGVVAEGDPWNPVEANPSGPTLAESIAETVRRKRGG